MYIAVKEVKSLEDYKLLLTFENGEMREFDMAPYMDKGLFRELKDVNLFSKVNVSFDTVEWDNGIDLCPEVLYEESVPVNK